jgi:hypothetical protein
MNSSDLLSVTVFDVVDDRNNPLVASDWTLLLSPHSRRINISVTATVLQHQQNVSSLRLSLYAKPHAVVAWFERGVMQTMDNSHRLFASNSTFVRMYATGPSAAFDVTAAGHSSTVLISDGNAELGRSGVQFVLAGKFPVMDAWTDDWRFAPAVGISKGDLYEVHISIAPTDGPFPAVGIDASGGTHLLDPITPGSGNANLCKRDMAAILNGIYANAVGGLTTYQLPGMIAGKRHEFT